MVLGGPSGCFVGFPGDVLGVPRGVFLLGSQGIFLLGSHLFWGVPGDVG